MKKLSLLAVLAFVPSVMAEENTWVDNQRQSVRNTLHSWSNNINDWLGETDPSKPASATLRVMMDTQWNRYDGFTYKPRVRGKIRLPVLKKKLNLVFGDEDLDNESRDKNRVGKNYNNIERDRRYNSREARNDNASVGLRWSDQIKSLGIETDLDGGLRSGGDVYGRLRLSREWDITDRFSTRLEQIYRYGINSRHYLRTNLENRYTENENTFIMNHSYYQYEYKLNKKTGWGNSLYRQHDWDVLKRLNYGLYVGGRLDSGLSKFNSWGPFVSYRQPIWRKWLFIQPEVNFYNDKDKDRSHYIGTFVRFEAIF